MSDMMETLIAFISKAKNIIAGSPRIRLLKLMPKGSVCAEIGVWKGEFSREILKIVRPERLHLIDPWKYQTQFGKRFYGGAFAKKQQDMDDIYTDVVTIFKENKKVLIHREFSEDVAKIFDDNYFDWVYIDGNHYYEFVKKDLELYYPKVKKGGFLAGDDYLWTSPELNGDRPVKRAVDDFVTHLSGISVRIIKTQFLIKKI